MGYHSGGAYSQTKKAAKPRVSASNGPAQNPTHLYRIGSGHSKMRQKQQLDQILKSNARVANQPTDHSSENQDNSSQGEQYREEITRLRE
mmetsp:Transcript_20661/g.31518  ORF Transcript_20661/g.31518 Transcript_20661/m.31518 type:complete len:90 (-) Transcript_20661:667-936(-)